MSDVTLDHDRAGRRGYPEAVLCQGKSTEQLSRIAEEISGMPDRVTLFTRITEHQLAAVLEHLPEAHHDTVAQLLVWPPQRPPSSGGQVMVLSAGTSDQPVAREAALTARYLGRETATIHDVGVAGLHRLLDRIEEIRAARAVVCVAGMDGALPGVVAGLVGAPVIAVPTSVGYGASFSGLAPLLTMLNACAPGVAVVNIDNGYGAGHLAAQITAP